MPSPASPTCRISFLSPERSTSTSLAGCFPLITPLDQSVLPLPITRNSTDPGRVGLVIHADPRVEPAGRALEVEHQPRVGVGPEAVVERPAADRQRMVLDGPVLRGIPPALGCSAQVQSREPDLVASGGDAQGEESIPGSGVNGWKRQRTRVGLIIGSYVCRGWKSMHVRYRSSQPCGAAGFVALTLVPASSPGSLVFTVNRSGRASKGGPGFHGGSYPPGFQGWQRKNRRRPLASPRQRPYFCNAPTMYRLQLGSNRQTLPSNGLRVHW